MTSRGFAVGGRMPRAALVYAGLVGLPAVLIVVVLLLSGGGRPRNPVGGAPSAGVVGALLLALPVILLACAGMTRVFRALRQPSVLGEIFAGLLLGPSFLGLLLPKVHAWLFPAALTTPINLLSQLGLVFFMFVIGYELDLVSARRGGPVILMVAHASIAIPFLSGVLLAFGLRDVFGRTGVGFLPFALFIGVSLSITAFPVLARIVTDRGLDRSPLGSAALASAAIGDVTAWMLLIVVIATARNASLNGMAVTLVLGAAFCVFSLRVVRPVLAVLLTVDGEGKRRIPEVAVLPLLLCGAMLSALATDSLGLHAIFGAFLFGVAAPRGSGVVKQAANRIEVVTGALLLPLFFVYTGLRTDFALLATGWQPWLWCVLVLLAAVTAKATSAAAAARISGLGWHDSLSLGALMNCRGLTELVVLNIGLDLKIITPELFTVFSIMALVSTLMTCPALGLIEKWVPRGREFLSVTGGN